MVVASSASAESSLARTTARLSASGQAQWQLESLLRRVYGTAPVWADAQDPRGTDFDRSGQVGCGPLAD